MRCIPASIAVTAVLAAPAGASPTETSVARPTPALGGIGIRLIDVSAGSGSRAENYIVDHVAPGALIHRGIEVSNTTASNVHIVLYASSAFIAKGAFLGAVGHIPNPLSTWTSVSPGSSGVPAGGLLTAAVTIAVPTDAASGEQYGVIWAETRSPPIAGGNVVQVSRVGIRIYLAVGSGGPPMANFTIDSLIATRSPDNRPTVLTTVHNTGGSALDVSGTLRLTAGPGGVSIGPLPVTIGSTLAIGQAEPVTIALDKRLPVGPWDARITVRNGPLERSALATITFPGTPRPTWLYPTIAGLGVLLLLGGSILLLGLRRRHQSTTRE
jgi:hypothetical protein